MLHWFKILDYTKGYKTERFKIYKKKKIKPKVNKLKSD